MACSNEFSQYCLYFFPPAKRGKQKWLPWKVANTTDCYLLICHYISIRLNSKDSFQKLSFRHVQDIGSTTSAAFLVPSDNRKKKNNNCWHLLKLTEPSTRYCTKNSYTLSHFILTSSLSDSSYYNYTFTEEETDTQRC